MALHLDVVADLLRVTRNDAGRPTGRAIDRDAAYVTCRCAPGTCSVCGVEGVLSLGHRALIEQAEPARRTGIRPA